MKISPVCILHSPCNSAEQALRIIQTRLPDEFCIDRQTVNAKVGLLNELLIKHPSATFIAKAEGDDLTARGIPDGSLLIVDRTAIAHHNSTIIASIAGELSVNILDLHARLLRPANPKQRAIPLARKAAASCEGVVTFYITPQTNCAYSC